jgi:hypothetical protein
VIERLARLEEGQKGLYQRMDSMEKRIDDLRADVQGRLNLLTWMLGIFTTIGVAILGAVGRILWRSEQRLLTIETAQASAKEEMAFLHSLIEKLLPPRSFP